MATKVLEEYLEADFDNGVLLWKKSPADKIKVGDTVSHVSGVGYIQFGLKGKKYRAHSVIYYLYHGRWPAIIDHIDRNKTNNRIENLREVTAAQNSHNLPVYKNNKLGVKGVIKTNRGKYRASIHRLGKTTTLGYFDTIEEATSARCAAEINFNSEGTI